ncbi:hypothetical protein B0H13DRAFT_1978306 [Mycena leptocephala]|nr:hypothetical protein B0H13DRAFT_1978306 [Mycena leptocephala]
MIIDLSTLSVFPATPEQITESRRRTLSEWGKGLTLEEHLARDASQDQFDNARDGQLITWVLAPRHDPQTLDFKCACETFKRTGLVVDPAKNTGVETVICYAVASVEGTRNGLFSGIWSDVGDFYNACGPVPGVREGWVVRGTATTVWEVAASPVSNNNAAEWTWLDDSAVSKLWEEDAEMMRSDMEKSESPGISFTYLPNQGVASFQYRRLEIFLQRLAIPPRSWGVASPDHAAYATWSIDPRPPAPRTLTVTRIRANSQNFGELVGKILEVAQKHDVKRVEMWNLPAELEVLSGTLGATTYSRKDHLPAFKWYGKEPEAEVSWAFNERFCWC